TARRRCGDRKEIAAIAAILDPGQLDPHPLAALRAEPVVIINQKQQLDECAGGEISAGKFRRDGQRAGEALGALDGAFQAGRSLGGLMAVLLR
ncbi:MAG TPA: hypothetical protein VGE07_26255, partial [Herpetosiphonaceae bacterium]